MSDQGWHTDAFPELRSGPPWVMQEMIAAQPALVHSLLDNPPPHTSGAAAAIAVALESNRPIVVCGCGTSEHAAHAIVALICAAVDPHLAPPRAGAARVERRLPTIALELETVLHGQLAGHEPADALILVAITDHSERDRVARRAAHVARAGAAIGLPVAGLLSDPYDWALPAELTPAGRIVTKLADPTLLNPGLAALLAGAGALQTLTLEMAHVRHTNLDLIRREQAPYRNAAQEAERSANW